MHHRSDFFGRFNAHRASSVLLLSGSCQARAGHGGRSDYTGKPALLACQDCRRGRIGPDLPTVYKSQH